MGKATAAKRHRMLKLVRTKIYKKNKKVERSKSGESKQCRKGRSSLIFFQVKNSQAFGGAV